MRELSRGRTAVSTSRPKGRIVAKDLPSTGLASLRGRGTVRSLHARGAGTIALGHSGSTVGSVRGQQILSGSDYALSHQITGFGHALEMAPGGRFFLACGSLRDGDEASCYIVDHAPPGILDGYPLRTPYLWISPPRADRAGGRFIAKTPAHVYGTTESTADPKLVADHPEIAPFLARPMRLLEVDRDTRTARPLLREDLDHRGAEHLCASPDGSRLYLATTTDVMAVDRASGDVIWRQPIGTYGSTDFVSIYALSLSADGAHLATGGIGAGRYRDHALTILDAATGKIVHSMGTDAIGGSSIGALAWHPSGWLAAGSSSGSIAHVQRNGHVRTYRGAPKGIQAMLFVEDGAALLIGGTEKHLRLYALLDDERNGTF